MKKLGLTAILFLLLLAACTHTEYALTYTEDPEIKGLATPVMLNVDTTSIVLSDFVASPEKIDSIIVPDFLKLVKQDQNHIQLIKEPGIAPWLSDLNLYVNGVAYSIILKKNPKIPHEFVFHSETKVKSVTIKGEFNNWNPNNTVLEKDSNVWRKTILATPGKYQYLYVVDGVEMTDPFNEMKVPNGMGGQNSLLTHGISEKHLPSLSTASHTEKRITLRVEQGPAKYIVLWENVRIPEEHIEIIGSFVSFDIPTNAESFDRSYIRAYPANETGIGKDVLVPLHFGKVLENPNELQRTDKHAMILYNVFIDRFFNGNKGNDRPTNDPMIHPKANYFGGDIDGIKKKINDGYFTDLGVNTLWISPIVKNPEGAYGMYPTPETKFSAYHGYWPISFTEIDNRFGTKQEFSDLVSLSHQNNFNVLVDFVANHVHQDHPFYKNNKDWATNLYLPDGTLNTEKWDTHRLTTWFDTFLPTLDYSIPEVVETVSDSALYWYTQFSIDGFRHDATKHVPEVFWRALTNKMKSAQKDGQMMYQIGETYGSPELIASYVTSGQMDAQFDFNLYDAAVASLLQKETSFETLANRIEEGQEYYGSHHLMGNITGNQDRARFMSYADGSVVFTEDAKLAGWTREITIKDSSAFNKMKQLFSLVMTIPGVPVIYYGDEIGMPGANDPDNRRMMRFDDLTQKELDLRNEVARLAELRKNNLQFIYGDIQIIQADESLLVYTRKYFNDFAIVVINKSGIVQTVNFDFPKTAGGNIVSFRNGEKEFTGIITVLPNSYDIIYN